MMFKGRFEALSEPNEAYVEAWSNKAFVNAHPDDVVSRPWRASSCLAENPDHSVGATGRSIAPDAPSLHRLGGG